MQKTHFGCLDAFLFLHHTTPTRSPASSHTTSMGGARNYPYPKSGLTHSHSRQTTAHAVAHLSLSCGCVDLQVGVHSIWRMVGYVTDTRCRVVLESSMACGCCVDICCCSALLCALCALLCAATPTKNVRRNSVLAAAFMIGSVGMIYSYGARNMVSTTRSSQQDETNP